ncbi:hypothetical protein GGQ80_003369 [Sphingomonas jinjuensis]|uniref:Uncharacterized protein n=1 Tax=Sphingomonas jinjuensis TaxID=535907 RepID=A0A840FGZ1_9SPHN|nr:hypothetical protein [Sphingomonas jinjuensis]MBB4155446.1 hypothetical protein [Sphingomonas jinjuensis]
MAAVELQRRRLRSSYFPDVFFGGEHPWDILLVLFIAEQRGLHMAIAELLELSGGGTEAGNRWLAHFAKAGHVWMPDAGSGDGSAKLTSDAVRRLAKWLIASPGWPH